MSVERAMYVGLFLYLGSIVGAFWMGTRYNLAPDYLEGDLRSPAVQQARTDTRLYELEHSVEFFGGKVVNLDAQLEATKKRLQETREDLIRETGAREKSCPADTWLAAQGKKEKGR